MNKYKLLCLILAVLNFTACNVLKPQSSKIQPKSLNPLEFKLKSEAESKLFFDVEKKRLLEDKKSSILAYQSFVANYPMNATARFNLARMLFEQNSLLNALQNAEKAIQLEPTNRIFREFYAQMLLYNDKLTLAENQIDLLLKDRPNDEEYLFKKAMIQLQNNDLDKTIASFEQLEKVTGFNEELILQKKNILYRNGKVKEAEKEIIKLHQAYPELPKYTLMWIELAEQNKQAQLVDSLYNALELNYPNDPLAQVSLAQHFLEKKDKLKYETFLKKVMANKNLDASSKIGLLIPAIKSFEKEDSSSFNHDLIQMTKSIVDESPDHIDALNLYADILYITKDYKGAIIAYENSLRKDSSKIDTWIQLIGIHFESKSYDSVIELTKRCLTRFPKSNMAYFYKGLAYLQLEENINAIEALEEAVIKTKYNTELLAQMHSSLGDAYNTTKNYSKSDSNFTIALKFAPGDAGILNNYAYYLSLRKERLQEAEKMSKYSLEIQPNSKSFLDTYGWILYQQEKYEDAKIYIEQAIKMGGENDGTLYEHLGDVFYQLDNKEKAIENWQKAKLLGEKNPELLNKIKYGKISK